MTSLFHNINRTWSRRRVSRGESNGSARLLDWSPPPLQQQPSSCSSSPFPADGHTNRRFLFFLSNQLAICLNIQHSTAPVNRFFPLFYGLFIRSYYLMERPAGCCAIEAARLYGNGREQIREVALQTRSTSSWRIAIPPASGVISLVYQRDSNKSKYRICGLRFECWRHSEVAVLRPRQQKRKFNLRRKFGRALFSLLISDTFHSA